MAVLALSSVATAQVWTPHKRSHVHASSTTTSKTRKPVAEKAKRGKSKVEGKQKKPAKHATKKRRHKGDDFTYTEEDYPTD